MIKILQVRNIDSFVESRRQKTSEKDRKIVQSILNDVRKNGDSAVKKYERKFNGKGEFAQVNLRVDIWEDHFEENFRHPVPLHTQLVSQLHTHHLSQF